PSLMPSLREIGVSSMGSIRWHRSRAARAKPQGAPSGPRPVGYSDPVKPIRIGLLGVGTVGRAVARALTERRDVLSRAAGTPLVLQRAAVRDLSRERGVEPGVLTGDPRSVVRADDVDLVI